ncbi:MAG: formylglycine-generating enzyme family protein [Pirellulales bacterium]
MPKQLPLILLVVFFSLVNFVLGDEGQKKQLDTIPRPNASMENAEEVEPKPSDVNPTVYSQWPFVDREARKRQQETAKALSQPTEATNSIGVKQRLLPAGTFMMGSPADELERQRDEGPAHRVRITKPFFLGLYEVTLGQFRQFVDATNYQTDAEKDRKGGWGYTGDDSRPFKRDPQYTWRHTGFPQDADHPVVNVSWNDAVAFCRWLSRKEAATYRLPTEAEWEYACRAGTATRFYNGDDAAGVARMGNVADATMNQKFAAWMKVSKVDREKIGTSEHTDGYVFTAPVGCFQANAFGLYDMHGNVWEWCADWDKADYYRDSPTDDPPGPADGTVRIRRGGSWLHSPTYSRSARRRRYAPDARNSPIGFRIARSLQKADEEASEGRANPAK